MINWKLRFKNKTTLVSLVLAIIELIYMICRTFGIDFKIEQQQIVDIAMAIIGVLSIVGIVVDPTTEGVGDSARALNYIAPSTPANALQAEEKTNK